MGLCLSYDNWTTFNESEDFTRNILRAFKSRNYEIDYLQRLLYSATDQSRRVNFIYKYILNKDDINHIKYLEAIINIPNTTNDYDNDKFMIIKLVTLSKNNKNKIHFLQRFFGVSTLNELITWCKSIWEISWMKLNEVVYDLINDKTGKLGRGLKKWQDDVFNNTNFNRFCEEKTSQFKLMISRERENAWKECTEFWEMMVNEYDYLFNWMELRHYFYIKYS